MGFPGSCLNHQVHQESPSIFQQIHQQKGTPLHIYPEAPLIPLSSFRFSAPLPLAPGRGPGSPAWSPAGPRPPAAWPASAGPRAGCGLDFLRRPKRSRLGRLGLGLQLDLFLCFVVVVFFLGGGFWRGGESSQLDLLFFVKNGFPIPKKGHRVSKNRAGGLLWTSFGFPPGKMHVSRRASEGQKLHVNHLLVLAGPCNQPAQETLRPWNQAKQPGFDKVSTDQLAPVGTLKGCSR